MYLWSLLVIGIGLCSDFDQNSNIGESNEGKENALNLNENHAELATEDREFANAEPGEHAEDENTGHVVSDELAPASAEDDSNIVPEQVDVETFNNVVSRLETDGQEAAALVEEPKETWKLTSKTTKNFASDSCGARIEKSAPDVTGAKNVIKNDFDKYAKAPIDKKFAFTVELCEEIQIQRLFIGVNELFASRPSKFSVQAADKVKSEWHFLGVFNIEPSGKSNLLKENFNVTMTHQYFKFVKYEALEYSGDEPFSVLTSLQVFGFPIDAQKSNDYEDDLEDADQEGEQLGSGESGVKNIINGIKKILTGAPAENNGQIEQEDLVASRELLAVFQRCEWNGLVHRSCNLGCNIYADAAFNFRLTQVNMRPRISQISPPVEAVQTEQPKVATTTLDGPETSTKASSSSIASNSTSSSSKPASGQAPKGDTQVQNAIPGTLKQIAKLEKNLTWMGSYLETLSQTYKKQMDDVRASFEKTSSRLTKSEVATQQTQEQISRLLELVKFLFTEIDRLDTTLEKIIIAASVVVALQVLTVLLVCQLRRGQKKMRQLEENQVSMEMLKELLEGQKKKRKHGGGAGDGFSRRSSETSGIPKPSSRGKRPSKAPKAGSRKK
ncbi:unnamed protein product [Oikopleura dioica]|uniref:SUN domain-containing protein n=1 Tax=Oikopleura dioica TaxID=34765 RepID=E4X416_OIKDI|nr:unnamed protein product [Oikopleura dioica]